MPGRPGSDGILCWQFPLSFVFVCVNKLEAVAACFPPHLAFAAPKQQDGDERKEWIHQHRISDHLGLCQVAKLVLDKGAKLCKPQGLATLWRSRCVRRRLT